VPSNDSLILRRATLVTLAVGVVCTVVGTVVAGPKGLIAGVLGTVIAVTFFAAGQYIVGRVLKNSPETAFMTALVVYMGQILILFVLLLLLREATFFAPKVFAATIIACAITWILASATVTWRSKVLYVEPTEPAPSPASETEARK
jgi:ATP synthase protein I